MSHPVMRFRRVLRLATAFGIIGAATAIAAGADQSSPPQATFRVGVELVGVDFLAVGDDGRPVPDLKMEEIAVRVDRRERRVQQLQFIRVADEAPATAGDPRRVPVPPAFGTNRLGASGRNVLVVFDDSMIRAGDERLARDGALRFIDRLSPNDRVGVATQARVEVDPTTNRARVKAAISNVVGRAGAGVPTGTGGSAVQMAGAPLTWFKTFLQSLKNLDGPKTVVFVSGGAPSISNDPSVARAYADIAKVAGEVSAQLYIIQPPTLTFSASQTSEDVGKCSTCTEHYSIGERANKEGLEDLATVTGGDLFQLSGQADQIFGRIERQSAAYYLLGFQADMSERDGKSHRIEVRSTRPGVTIRARQDFTIPKGISASDSKATTVQMLQTGMAYRDLPLRVAAFSQRGRLGGIDVVVAVEPDDESTFAEIALGIVDPSTRKMAIAWPARNAKGRARVLDGATLDKGGPFQLRVAAAAEDGRKGSTSYDFEARLTDAGPVRLSDLIVGRGLDDGSFEPQLQFTTQASATGYLEVYGTLPTGTALSVSFALGRAADGQVLFTIPGILNPTIQSDRLTARGVIPMGAVPPGDYVVRAVVSVNGEVAGGVTRAVRKGR